MSSRELAMEVGVGRARNRFSRLSRREARSGLLFAAPSILLLVTLIAIPVVLGVRLSLIDSVDLTGRGEFVGLANYAHIFSNPDLPRVLLNTLVWTIGSLAGQIVIGLAAALLIDSTNKLMPSVRVLLLLPYVVPIIAQVVVWRWLLDGQHGVIAEIGQAMGILGPGQGPLTAGSMAMTTVIIMNIWRGFPFAMLIYWAALQTVDRSQVEAARVDGASALQLFWWITLPNLREATITLVVLRGIWTLMYFDLIWLTTSGGPVNATSILPTYIYETALGEFKVGDASAMATLSALVLSGLVLLYFLMKAVRAKAQGGIK